MSNFPGRRRTVGVSIGSGAGASSDSTSRHGRPSELSASLQNEQQQQQQVVYDFARRGIGTRSIYAAPALSSLPGEDTDADYSQTPNSIRDRTMLLSSLTRQTGRHEDTSSNYDDAVSPGLPVISGNSRCRSSDSISISGQDDMSSIDQILASGASSTDGNLSRLLRERLPPPMAAATTTTVPPGVRHNRSESMQLPPLNFGYLGPDRIPRNAKRQEPNVTVPLLHEQPSSMSYSSSLHWTEASQMRGDPESDSGSRLELLADSESESELQHSPYCFDQPPFEADRAHSYLQRYGYAAIDLVAWPLQYVPAVVLGLILNLLDGLSYGLIAFPVSIPVFDKFGPVGFSMYMLSTAVSQLVYSSGASAFRGANGSMLIEAIPFLYAMCETIVQSVGDSQPDRIVATTMVAYATSTIITGAVFFLLGFLGIGALVDFFPRHILVGCIGGVGYFLFQTGLEVTSRLKLELSWHVMRELLRPNTLGLWASSLLVAVLLRVLNTRFKHPLFVPVFFMLVPAAFYMVTSLLGLSLETLRAAGWVFSLPDSGVPFYHFYTLFDFGNTDWRAICQAGPTMLGLAFFSILHVPINVPALAVSTNADKVDTNRELVAHGISNILSGCLGSFQNYLVYSNSLLFIRSGGNSNLAGMMLCAATLGIFFSGPAIIGFIPTMVVGALIFHLGLELMREALVDTVGVVNRIEYATILSIVLAMAVLGFNEGIFLGILMACFFFILLYSRRSAVRKTYTGSAVRSTVRRLYCQRRFLDNVCKQIQVMRLQGFMFFGTINGVEASIRQLLDQRQWQANPIRFLVLDFALVNGMDFSAAEAFIRVRRLLEAREIYMVICGAGHSSEVGRALRKAGVWSDHESEYVQTFPSLNEALEWCENVLLQFYYLHQVAISGIAVPQIYSLVTAPHPDNVEAYGTSPRRAMVSEATHSALSTSRVQSPQAECQQLAVASLLRQAFQDIDSEQPVDEVLALIAPYFVRKHLGSGQRLWQAGAAPLGMYLVESGTLRVHVDNGTGSIEATESILPGTTLGELALVTKKHYHTTVIADGDVALWELSKRAFDELCATEPAQMLVFVRLALAYSAQGMSAITAYAFFAQ
ncbi:hypothetical protein GGH94_004485 [Coemansia aciculifera]|uniref:Sulfate transporter family protein n=1 Tax=Coemansia aciculifera TaxID=417176 RepID=A0A9W8ILT3_9FUNG|nr:hypothetical protein GGH94_004485 [Coemansia aciculifera]